MGIAACRGAGIIVDARAQKHETFGLQPAQKGQGLALGLAVGRVGFQRGDGSAHQGQHVGKVLHRLVHVG